MNEYRNATKTRQYTSAYHRSGATASRWARRAGHVGPLAALVALLSLSPSPAPAQGEAEADLEAVRERIAGLESELARETRRRDDGAAELERLERQIAGVEKALGRLAADIEAEQRRERSLEADAKAAAARLDDEQALLAEQVRLSYRTGRQERLKLLLSQESPADLGRMLTYYDYLNRARSRRIAATDDELAELRRVAAESRAARESLAGLRDERERELASMADARRDRARVIERLDRSIADSGREIDQLRAEESRLTELIAELSALLEGFPVESEAPFSSWRGRLSWPIAGEIAANFGQLREGGPLRWNGVLLAATAGTPVRAVYHGRVAYAGWLQGMGLLLVIDHGESFMSLYGHNQALLREPGDWVRPGDAIAEVGDTGGRRTPALYFEIRQDGEPVNPHDWIR